MSNPISAPVREVLNLFENELADVRFPDLEASVLQAAAAQALLEAEAVDRAEQALDQARTALTQAQEALLQKAQRALAYVRVYAEDDAPLLSRIEAIALPRAPRRPQRSPESPASDVEPASPPARRRGRPRKVDPGPELLDHTSQITSPTVSMA
jgi:hypothetical protein